MTIQGIDVASYQGSPNWSAVAAAGYQFALIKATEGLTYVNPTLAADWNDAKDAGLTRAAYHFCHPELNDPAAEAAYFLANVTLQPGDLIAADLESGVGNLLAWVQTFMAALAAGAGFKPLLYSDPGFLAAHGLHDPSLTPYGLWLADYQSTPPAAPAPWAAWTIWQSGTGQVSGVAGPVDLDTFEGTNAELQALGMPNPAPPAQPCEQQLAAAEARIAAAIAALTQ